MHNVKNKLKTHKDLDVWKESIKLAKEIYILTGLFPEKEMYGMVSQMRRCAVSISSNPFSTPLYYSSFQDIIKKRRLYEKNKVKQYWIVDTQEKEIYIYKLQDNGKYGAPEEYTKSDKIKVEGFEGLEIDLSLVFRTGVKENPEKI